VSATHNERVKLTATFLNGLGIAVFAVGGLAPSLAAVNAGQGPAAATAIIGGICVAAAFALHIFARRILGRLKE
jgi:hypothetical protein